MTDTERDDGQGHRENHRHQSFGLAASGVRDRIYVCAPFRAKTEMERQHNIWHAKQAGEELAKRGFAPVVPHVAVAYYHDSLPERDMMEICLSLLQACKFVYVAGGQPTEGMQIELAFAAEHKIETYEWR